MSLLLTALLRPRGQNMRAYMPDPKLQLNIHGRQYYMFLLNLPLFRQERSDSPGPSFVSADGLYYQFH